MNKFSVEPMTSGAYKNGEIINPAELEKVIRAAVRSFRTKKVSLGIGGASVIIKRITIPKVSNELLAEQVRWEAEQYIPYNIDEVNIDYVILNSEQSQETMDLLLVAAQQEKIKALSDVMSRAKLQVELMDVSSFALANCFTFNYPENNKGAFGLIDIGSFFTHFVIVHQGEVVFCRDIPSGGSSFDGELAKNLGIPIAQAIQMKEAGGDLPDIAVDTINKLSFNYSEQVLGAFEFFTETTQGFNVQEFYITGGGSLTSGLQPILQDQLKKPVHFMDPLRAVTPLSAVIKSNVEQDLQYRSAVAIGLALRKVGDV